MYDQPSFLGASEAPEKKKKGLSLFGGGKKQAPKGPDINEVLEQINVVGTRLSMIEDRSSNLTRRVQVADDALLKLRKKVDDEIKTINSDIVEMRRSITELSNKIDLIIKELKTRAGKEDVESVKKYIEMWEPLNFVTREEVERLISRVLGKEL